jgi:hypothetical protein
MPTPPRYQIVHETGPSGPTFAAEPQPGELTAMLVYFWLLLALVSVPLVYRRLRRRRRFKHDTALWTPVVAGLIGPPLLVLLPARALVRASMAWVRRRRLEQPVH